MKAILTTAITFALFISLLASPAKAQDDDWTLYQEKEGVEIYQKSTNCHDPSEGYHRRHILLKFVNTTNQDLEVSWFIETWYNGNCSTCHEPEDPEFFHSIDLKANETKEGSCDVHKGQTLKIYETSITEDGEKAQEDIAELTDYDLHKLRVKPQ
ncbi:MAG: hypothetical protein R6U19_01990 [Bacteroidales bacterium]